MIWLILGVALWWGAHFFKRVAPDVRASLGDPGKGAVALALLVSIVLMVIGYRAADGAVPTRWFLRTCSRSLPSARTHPGLSCRNSARETGASSSLRRVSRDHGGWEPNGPVAFGHALRPAPSSAAEPESDMAKASP